MDPENWLVAVFIAITALAGGASVAALITNYAKRHVTSAEAESISIASMALVAQKQHEYILDTDGRIDDLQREVASLRADLSAERARCDAELATLAAEIAAYRTTNKENNHGQDQRND